MKKKQVKKIKNTIERASKVCLSEIAKNIRQVDGNKKTVSMLQEYIAECRVMEFKKNGPVRVGLANNIENFIARVSASINDVRENNRIIERNIKLLNQKADMLSSKKNLLEKYIEEKNKQEKELCVRRTHKMMEENFSVDKDIVHDD